MEVKNETQVFPTCVGVFPSHCTAIAPINCLPHMRGGVSGIRNAFHAAVRQNLDHVTIDVIAKDSLDRIADSVQLAFERYTEIRTTIILKGAKAVEVTRDDYQAGKILAVLQDSL
jgi:hypothetical protein